MSSKEALTWLRKTVEVRLAAAQAILHTAEWGDLPWAVTECVNDARGDCACIIYQGIHRPPLEPQIPPVRYIADAETPEIAAWITANGPHQIIADCESDLEILNEHRVLFTGESAEGYEEYGIVRLSNVDRDHGCVRCHYWAQGAIRAYGICRTVQSVARRYRHLPAYAGHWDPLYQDAA